MKMNLYNDFSKKDKELLKNIGREIEDREYSQEEVRKLLINIEEEIVNCSTKNNDINYMNNKYSNILKVLENKID